MSCGYETIFIRVQNNTKKAGKGGKFHKLEMLPKHINSLLIYLTFFLSFAFNLKRPQETTISVAEINIFRYKLMLCNLCAARSLEIVFMEIDFSSPNTTHLSPPLLFNEQLPSSHSIPSSIGKS